MRMAAAKRTAFGLNEVDEEALAEGVAHGDGTLPA